MASSDSGPNQLVFIFYVALNRWLPGNNIYNHAVLKAKLKKKNMSLAHWTSTWLSNKAPKTALSWKQFFSC